MTGAGNSNIFWNFHPDPWGFMIQIDGSHIFENGLVVETTN